MTKVLIADDDPAILDSVGILLEFEGFAVEKSLYGAALLELDDKLPDLVLLDIWMSGVDGRELCKTLKANERTRNIPVVLISASNDIEQAAIDAGADDFLPKPFDVEKLLSTINKHLPSS